MTEMEKMLRKDFIKLVNKYKLNDAMLLSGNFPPVIEDTSDWEDFTKNLNVQFSLHYINLFKSKIMAIEEIEDLIEKRKELIKRKCGVQNCS